MDFRIIDKNKIIITSILIIIISIFLCCLGYFKNSENPVINYNVTNNEVNSEKHIALMIEQNDGKYKEIDSNKWPKDMKFNSKLSNCIDINGNKLDNILNYDDVNNNASIIVNGTTYCYLYFDKEKSVYGQVISDAKSSNGAVLLSDKGSREYDTYYYTGDVTNNNVLYGNFCWKMVITTKGHGVKMIYNGVPQVQSNGSINCNNTGSDTQLPNTRAFNANYNSPAYVGYMYNKVYNAGIIKMNKIDSYKYGNSFTYSNGTYTLTNTIEFSNWQENYNTLSNNHYTCFNNTGTCSSLYYIYFTSSDEAVYITLNDGKSVNDAIKEMLYADDVNSKDSLIKKYIDTWYEDNLLNETDKEGNTYSNYLQNTIYCNDRTISDYSTNSWNPNGGSTNIQMHFLNSALDCTNKNDQFTLKVEKGGTAGYGNNALDYPIGLLSYAEAHKVSLGGYLFTGSNYWLMTPNSYSGDAAYIYYFTSVVGSQGLHLVTGSAGVRPVIALSENVDITTGNGSYTNPYQVKLAQ